MSASDKVQITYSPMLPATCVVCAKSANGNTKFLDFQKDLDYYGAIVICEDCAKNMLQALDFVTGPEHRAMLESFDEISNSLSVVRAKNVELTNALDTLLGVRPDLAKSVDDSSESVDSESEQTTLFGTDKNSGTDKSVASRGPEILFGATGSK